MRNVVSVEQQGFQFVDAFEVRKKKGILKKVQLSSEDAEEPEDIDDKVPQEVVNVEPTPAAVIEEHPYY